MENKQTQITKLDPALIQKLQEWESKKPENRQLTVLSDIADIMQELLSVADDTKKGSEAQIKALGAVLTDSREQLVELNKKEAPEAPDYAKPVVDAVAKLGDAIKEQLSKLDIKPEVKVSVPKMDAPQVNVESPSISVDLKGVEKILKEDIPKAFKQAIDAMPKTEIPEAPDRWEEVIDWLKSIDTASRLKQQAPDQIKVTNVDGSAIGGAATYQLNYDTTTTVNAVYLGKSVAGTADSDPAWQIVKINTTTQEKRYADAVTTFTKVWDDITTYTY
jgi:hypothetical protein